MCEELNLQLIDVLRRLTRAKKKMMKKKKSIRRENDMTQSARCIAYMLHYYRLWCLYPRLFRRIFSIFILSFFIGLIWTILVTLLFDNETIDGEQPPQIFCFVLSANDRHLTSSPAIIHSWGKRCDRFYFIARLQNSSVELMMLEKFENITDVTSTSINRMTLDVLLYLRNEQLAAPYHWFLRASDDSYVIVPNLRRLVKRSDHRPLVYTGDVEQMYEKYHFSSTGSVMLFNRKALDRLIIPDSDDYDNDLDLQRRRCFSNMIYDHQFVACMKQTGVNINPVNDNLILSQNLAIYRTDKRLKSICCSPDTVAFRSMNETDMLKFDFFYHNLDAKTKLNTY